MPSAQKSTTPVGIDIDIVEGRYAELGEYTVGFETFTQRVDTAPYFRGLPNDRCPCAHFGYMTAGQISVRYADGQETFVEGDAYLAPPGHLTTVTRNQHRGVYPHHAPGRGDGDDWPQSRGHDRGSDVMTLAGAKAVVDTSMLDAESAGLAERLVRWLATGIRPENLLSPNVFGDVWLPHWRVQTNGPDELYAVRGVGHSGPGDGQGGAPGPDGARIPSAVRRALAGPGPAMVRAGDHPCRHRVV